MASEEEQTGQDEHSTIPTLPLFSLHNIPPSPEHPWMSTPPLYTTSASIPFTWEEEPGKPRLTKTPPGLTKTPSPNTVLDGPYKLLNSSTPKFISSSFRFLHEESLDVGNKKPKRRRLVFPSWRQRTSRNGKKEIVGNSSRSFVFPSTCSEIDSGFQFDEATSDKNVNISRISSRNGSIHSLSPKPQFWASVYQGFKHAIPWKTSRKSRKDVFV
ncbi:hypothetical protein LIER_22738 [Lithospermum erythrorhizon]|uniref:Uncharacterized protein n=1 Tax=Lithospermum erythrorhizon TaxID=34254 RepID=A0AAV3QYC1_LITER